MHDDGISVEIFDHANVAGSGSQVLRRKLNQTEQCDQSERLDLAQSGRSYADRN